MRVLVDTSVWSLSLRKGGPSDHPGVRKLALLIENNEDIVLIGVILQEVLQAFRDEGTFRKVATRLDPMLLLDLTREDYVAAARLHRRCASHGIAVSTVDCQIASAAIRHNCALLTVDKDFEQIKSVSALKLV